MLKPDRFSCSQKICLKWDPPVCQLSRSDKLPTRQLQPSDLFEL